MSKKEPNVPPISLELSDADVPEELSEAISDCLAERFGVNPVSFGLKIVVEDIEWENDYE